MQLQYWLCLICRACSAESRLQVSCTAFHPTKGIVDFQLEPNIFVVVYKLSSHTDTAKLAQQHVDYLICFCMRIIRLQTQQQTLYEAPDTTCCVCSCLS